jgi:hypothetical protein
MNSDKNKIQKLTVRLSDVVILTAQDKEQVLAAFDNPPTLGIRIDETVQMNDKVGNG